MRLIDDDQVEMTGAELRLALLLAVNQVHHRRIGGEKNTAFTGTFGDEIDRRSVGQMRLEGASRLIHQRHPVGEEQHALHPASAHQEIDQSNNVRVLPEPVAMTSSALRSPSCSKLLATFRIARCW